MTFHRLPRRLFLAALLAAPLAAQAGDMGMAHKGEIQISGAWVRAALPNRPTAGYMMLMNKGGAGDRLIAARSPDFETIELHESVMKEGVMSMSPIEAVEIAAGGMAELKPGGKHLMLFGGGGLKEGETATLTLVFESAGEVTLTVPVMKKGMEGHGGHGGHKTN
jgi:copper(I)-binding protein